MRIEYLRETLKERRFLYSFIFLIFAYIVFYVGMMTYFNGSFVSFLKSYRVSYLVPALFLNAIMSFLFGFVGMLTYKQFRMMKNVGNGSFFSVLGLFGTALATGCPGCIVGFFPFVLSLFGISASLSTLPFNGLEITAASAVLLGLSIFLMSKPPKFVCPVK